MMILEEEEKNNLEAAKITESARMDLVQHLHDDLIQDDELDKVKLMKGVEEEVMKF